MKADPGFKILRGGGGGGVELSQLPSVFEQKGLNIVQPDQMPLKAASYQDLYCLPYIQQFQVVK